MAGAAAWLCTTWHVYLLNGLNGQVEDRANGSRRPLADGRLGASTGHRMLRFLEISALLLGAFAGPVMVLLVAVMLGLGWYYSAGWRRPGKSSAVASSAVIAAGGAVTFLAGWYAGGGRAPDASFAVVAMAMSLWMALAGMTKDLPDVIGDRLAGRLTLPVVLGPRRARTLLAFLSLAVGAGALLAAWWTRTRLPFAGMLSVGALLVAGSLLLGHRVHPRRPYRFFMIVQYAVHLPLIAGLPLALFTGN
jgi:4-hydroxybenzoate polyprenyltransferase